MTKYLLAFASVCAMLLATGCNQSPQRLLATANKYHQNKKYKEASILYQKVLTKDKTNAEAYYREGLNLLDAGSPIDAARFLRRAVDLKPDNTDAEVKLAEIYLTAYMQDAKKYKPVLPEVRELTGKILEQQPNSPDGLRLQGILYVIDRNSDKALATFAKANTIQPYSRKLVGWYAQTLVSANKTDEAIGLVRDMLGHDRTWSPGYDFLFLQYTRQNDAGKAEAILRERMQNQPSDAVAVINLANFLLSAKRYPEAEATIRRVLNDKKTFPGGHQIVGDFYFRAKKFDQAIQEYQAGAKDDEKNALAYQERIIRVNALTGHRDQALQMAKELASKHAKDASINTLYASLLLQTGSQADLSASLSDLKRLVQNNPESPILHLDLARAYFGLNDKDKALSEALEAVREQPQLMAARVEAARVYEDRAQHAKALEQTDLVLQAAPSDPDARLIRTRALIGMNESDRALPELEELVQQYPGLNEARLQLGNLYLTRRQYPQATDQFQKVWTSNPPDKRGFIGIQTVKLAEGKTDEAVKALEDLLNKNPNVAAYRFDLANFQATAGTLIVKSDPDRAQKYFLAAAENYKQIAKTTPNAAEVWLRLGILQRQLEQYDAAIASFQQSETASPRSPDAFINQATLLDQLGRKKEAVEVYNKVLGIDPENTLALNNLAFLIAESGSNLDQAMTFAEKAKKKYPNNPAISDTLGFVYYQKNLNAEAVGIFRQVVQDDPQRSLYRFHLAMALLKQGDKQGARTEAEKALKSASQPEEQIKIRSFVSQIG